MRDPESRLSFELVVTEDFIDRVAQRVIERLDLQTGDEWLTVGEAAAYLHVPKSRMYRRVSQHAVPYHKDGQRTFFSRSELDGWRRNGGKL
jgi:excisionase family DNA binding protein